MKQRLAASSSYYIEHRVQRVTRVMGLPILAALHYSITPWPKSWSPLPFWPRTFPGSRPNSARSESRGRLDPLRHHGWPFRGQYLFRAGNGRDRSPAYQLPLDVHLMIENADHYVPRFVEAGANSITVHMESESRHDVPATLKQIRQAGCRVGLTLNPATAVRGSQAFSRDDRFASRDDGSSRFRRPGVRPGDDG